jgi:hypothetical protein
MTAAIRRIVEVTDEDENIVPRFIDLIDVPQWLLPG